MASIVMAWEAVVDLSGWWERRERWYAVFRAVGVVDGLGGRPSIW